MSVCTFFGHSDCYGFQEDVLRSAIEDVYKQGTKAFMVGNQGSFDSMVRRCLKSLSAQYPDLQYSVVLAYLPVEKDPWDDMSDTMYPEGLEKVHPKFAIDWRNRYLVGASDVCVCYINHTWGGAYKFACLAKRRGLKMINLGSLCFG